MFMIMDSKIQDIDETVDSMVKALISNRSSFYVESVKVTFSDGEPFVELECLYTERGWDIDNQKMTDEYSTHKFEITFSFEYFDWEDLPNLIYSKIDNIVMGI